MFLIFANDFITMSLASDTVRFQAKPGKWDIKFLIVTSLTVASLWLVFSFAMVYLARDIFHLSLPALQTWVFLLLVYSGLASVFIVRTRLSFWKVRPGKFLMISTLGDILFVSLFAHFGILMEPLDISLILIMAISVAVFMCMIDTIKKFFTR
jgi:H+-transporting ATPase